MILPISMVTCAFATIGIIETANVRLINLHLIEVVLNADLRDLDLPPQGRKETESRAAHVDLDQHEVRFGSKASS